MQIQKVLNNNVVVALDENGAETVLMGRGLGFGCRPGGEVCQAKVEKRFSMPCRIESEEQILTVAETTYGAVGENAGIQGCAALFAHMQ